MHVFLQATFLTNKPQLTKLASPEPTSLLCASDFVHQKVHQMVVAQMLDYQCFGTL